VQQHHDAGGDHQGASCGDGGPARETPTFPKERLWTEGNERRSQAERR
jgi:hypothetical protein